MNNPHPSPKLILHRGGESVDRATVRQVKTPSPTDTWYPLSHEDLIVEVEAQLRSVGFDIVNERHALSHEGTRYFGVFGLTAADRTEDRGYGWVVGLRNSHDKSFPAGLVAGSRVFVCDNLAFNGEVRISRKHTKYAVRDLRHLTARAVGQLGACFRDLDQRIAAYCAHRMNDVQAHDLVIRAVDCRAITASQIPNVLAEWRKPKHEAFGPRTAWSLFNAVTEVHKNVNPHTVLGRSQALHGLFDGLVGMN